jgi:hypothetical protein
MNQKLALVDVRIDIGSLFNTMMVASSTNTKRPTVLSYLENLKDGKVVKSISDVSERTVISEIDYPSEAKYLPTNKTGTGLDEVGQQTVMSRVNAGVKGIADSIINQIPGGFRIGNN